METLILQPKTKEQLTALKAVIKALKIDFKSEKVHMILNLKNDIAGQILKMEKV